MSAIAPTESSAYLAGMPREALSDALWERYLALLNAGVPSDAMLVLLEGTTRTRWTALLKGDPEPHIAPEARPLPASGGLDLATRAQRVHTPAAFIKEELRLWWPLIEERLEAWGLGSVGPQGVPMHHADPYPVAIDLSQYLMSRFTADIRGPEHNCLEDSESPPHLQNIQLLDALARGIENGHSLQAHHGSCTDLARGITRRLYEGTGGKGELSPLFQGVELCLTRYVEGMLQHRCLDYALQLDLFEGVLLADERYRRGLRGRLRHLLVERLDELPPRWHRLIKTLEAEGVTVFATLQADHGREGPILGGLRAYVGADPDGAWELAEGWEATSLTPIEQTPAQAGLAEIGRALYEGVRGGYRARALDLAPGTLLRVDRYAFEDMLDAVVADLSERFDEGVAREEVAIVAPAIDAFLLWGLQNRLTRKGIPLYVYAGTNRLIQNRAVRILLTLAKLCHPEWRLAPGRYEWIELLELETGLNPLQLGRLADKLTSEAGLGHPDQLEIVGEAITDHARRGYRSLYEWIEAMRESHARPDLPAFLRRAFAERFAPSRQATVGDAETHEAWQREISQIGQLIELSETYREVLERVGTVPLPVEAPQSDADRTSWEWSFLRFLHAGTIAERPFFRREPHRVSVMLATASQLAEKGGAERPIRHLYLLDVGSPRWIKRDRKELTNARVLANAWPGGAYRFEDEERDAADKLAKTLWALCRLPTESLRVYSCLTDAEGREQAGDLPWIFEAIAGGRHERHV